jgi:hypothetical protein
MGRKLIRDGEVNKSDIKLSGDIAWEEVIKPNCACGAAERRECTCKRSKKFKSRAEEIRENWFGEEWTNPIKSRLDSR